MTIMPNSNETDNAISKCSKSFMKRFHINQRLRSVHATKEKGIPVYDIFTGKNLYTLLETYHEKIYFEKDIIYRFLSKASINWELFVKSGS